MIRIIRDWRTLDSPEATIRYLSTTFMETIDLTQQDKEQVSFSIDFELVLPLAQNPASQSIEGMSGGKNGNSPLGRALLVEMRVFHRAQEGKSSKAKLGGFCASTVA